MKKRKPKYIAYYSLGQWWIYKAIGVKRVVAMAVRKIDATFIVMKLNKP